MKVIIETKLAESTTGKCFQDILDTSLIKFEIRNVKFENIILIDRNIPIRYDEASKLFIYKLLRQKIIIHIIPSSKYFKMAYKSSIKKKGVQSNQNLSKVMDVFEYFDEFRNEYNEYKIVCIIVGVDKWFK